MLSTAILNIINQQINQEQYASQIYLMAYNWFNSQGLLGFADWAKKQAEEEREHTLKFIDYINLNNGKLTLETIIAPQLSEISNILSLFKEILDLEQKVTLSINNMMKIATAENDFATQNFLAWFVDEQVKGEFAIQNIITKLSFLSDTQENLEILYLDAALLKAKMELKN
jgi:ferritin